MHQIVRLKKGARDGFQESLFFHAFQNSNQDKLVETLNCRREKAGELLDQYNQFVGLGKSWGLVWPVVAGHHTELN